MAQEYQNAVVIGVNYESDQAALRFVHSLGQVSKPIDVTVVLVDNTERSDSSEFFGRVRVQDPEVICLKAPSNLGYFGGASYGLGEYLKSKDYPDWVIVSNVDIEFGDDAFFGHLRDIDCLESVGVVAPSIWSNHYRHDMNPKMISRPTRRRIQFYKLLYRSFYATRLYVLLSKAKYALNFALSRMFLSSLQPSQESPFNTDAGDGLKLIYAPQGACIIFSKMYFLRGGSLDYPTFLFHEEIYVAETARNKGLRVIHDPRLKVYHNDHISTGEYRSRRIVSYLYESTVFIANAYFN